MIKYTEAHIEFVKKHCANYSLDELAEKMNNEFGLDVNASKLKSLKARFGIKSGRPKGFPVGFSRLFTQEQIEWIKENYKTLSAKEITKPFNEKFNRSVTWEQIRTFVKNNGIKSGRTGQFEKGAVSWNAGTKGVMKPNSGSFKKGDKPANQRRLGDERICSKDGYVLIKVNQTNPYTGEPTWFRLKHRVIWEEANGPVPDGMAIIFKDGNKLNCTLENLDIVGRDVLAHLNCRLGYGDMQPELKPTVVALAKLETATKSIEKTARQ